MEKLRRIGKSTSISILFLFFSQSQEAVYFSVPPFCFLTDKTLLETQDSTKLRLTTLAPTTNSIAIVSTKPATSGPCPKEKENLHSTNWIYNVGFKKCYKFVCTDWSCSPYKAQLACENEDKVRIYLMN